MREHVVQKVVADRLDAARATTSIGTGRSVGDGRVFREGRSSSAQLSAGHGAARYHAALLVVALERRHGFFFDDIKHGTVNAQNVA